MTTAVKERPIIFSTDMVRAILDGRKDQTRRVMKPQPTKIPDDCDQSEAEYWWSSAALRSMVRIGGWELAPLHTCCPYGQVGDHLWVRETHYKWTGLGNPPTDFIQDRCYSDNYQFESLWSGAILVTVPSIFMPRWASRINLEITGIRVERVQEITEDDATAEGSPSFFLTSAIDGKPFDTVIPSFWFETLWDTINAKRGYGWDVNPWVWVIEFKNLQQDLTTIVRPK